MALRIGRDVFTDFFGLVRASLDRRTSVRPITQGKDIGGVSVGRAVPWKGAKGMKELAEINPTVAKGLKAAQEMSEKNAAFGYVVVKEGADVYPMGLGAYKNFVEGKNRRKRTISLIAGDTDKHGLSYARAMDIVRMHGLPTATVAITA